VESTRVDRWLWSIRLYKTRADATAACRGGHVRLNGRIAKPATPVRVGDRIEAHVGRRDRVVEVARVIEKRVGAPLAAECYIDHSPPPPPAIEQPWIPRRDRGTGRPTKRERRQLERWRGRNR
jgi:ribosome-associated heat shock protein Hsp15